MSNKSTVSLIGAAFMALCVCSPDAAAKDHKRDKHAAKVENQVKLDKKIRKHDAKYEPRRDYIAIDRAGHRRIVTDYYTREGLPPGLAKRNSLPPGLARQLRERGRLPPGLQKRLTPLPPTLVRRLPPAP